MNDLNRQISSDLHKHLKESLKNLPSDFFDIYEYATFPTGKLFRANLIWRFFCDLNQINISELETKNYPNIQHLSSAIELHHAYTLVHDDLPCMDNDDYRRGKLSTHKKYNEWKALLVGDGLLNLSYELVARIEHQKTPQIIANMAQLCGPQGLILGQYMDLKQEEVDFNFKTILQIHELKTSNLFTTSLLGVALLSDKNSDDLEVVKSIGKNIGIFFQLIDDLTELCEPVISSHEKEINPWSHDFNTTRDYLLELIDSLKVELENHKLLNEMIKTYTKKFKDKITENQTNIEDHLKNNLGPVISKL